ncbi:MAG: hypothetical protein K0V04_15010 [Deltaproteobacteria bacterium]|nr:hypothetical protein [Deltaproteobacteria bacterium]
MRNLLPVTGLAACLVVPGCRDEAAAAEDPGSTEGDDDTGTAEITEGDASGGSEGDTGPPEGEIGDPILPLAEVGPTGDHYLQSRVQDDVLYVCSGRGGLQTFDISDPTQLRPIGGTEFSLGNRCQYLAIDAAQQVAYITHAAEQTNPQSFVGMIDISNPGAPQERWVLPQDGQPAGLAADGPVVAVAAKAEGLSLFDVSTMPGQPLATQPLAEAWNVVLRDGLAYVANGADGLAVVDVGDPGAPTLRGSVDLEGVAKDLVLDGDRAYVALGGEGVAVVDITDPSSPATLDWERTPGSSLALAISPQLDALFVADWNDIRLFDISNRDDLYPLGREPLPLGNDRDSRTMGIAASGEYLFGSNWDIVAAYQFVPGVNAPDLVLETSQLQVPDTAPGDSSVAIVTLSNDGPRPLETLSFEADAGLQIADLPSSIDPFTTVAVEVEFSASTPQPFVGQIVLSSDDVDQPAQSLQVAANLPGLGVGDVVPDWQYFDLDTNSIQLGQYDGPVLLAYFATF